MQIITFFGGFCGCFWGLEIVGFDGKKRGQDKNYVVYSPPNPVCTSF